MHTINYFNHALTR